MPGCDKCSMCCKLLVINEPTLQKPLNKWCEHCSKPGCSIYDDRPNACKAYSCVYIQSQTSSFPLPLKFRPDKCKVVIDITEDGIFAIFRIDPAYPKAIDSDDVKIAISVLSKQHSIVATLGDRKQLVFVNPLGRQKLRELGIKDDQTVWYG